MECKIHCYANHLKFYILFNKSALIKIGLFSNICSCLQSSIKQKSFNVVTPVFQFILEKDEFLYRSV